jgi:hypothetical protein
VISPTGCEVILAQEHLRFLILDAHRFLFNIGDSTAANSAKCAGEHAISALDKLRRTDMAKKGVGKRDAYGSSINM